MSAQYYLLSLKHGYVGNSHQWWGPNSCGYTPNLDAAGVYSESEAREIQDGFNTFAVPVAEARRASEPHVTRGMEKYKRLRAQARER